MSACLESQSEKDLLRSRVIDATKALAIYRKLAADKAAALKAKQEAYLAENQFLISEVATARKMVEESEIELKALGVVLYKTDPTNKKPAPGIGIQVSIKTRIIYDQQSILAWAKTKGLFLQLNTEAFDAYALSAPKADLPEGVTIETWNETKATLASDLGKVVSGMVA